MAKLGNAGVADQDVQRTLAELTVATICDALPDGVHRLLVCGGGVHNDLLMQLLAERLADTVVVSTAEAGVDPDWVEATLFAWLAKERLAERTMDTRAITGASHPVLLGRVDEPETET